MRFFVLHPLAILVAIVINCLPSSLPIMYAIILLLGVLLAPGIDSRPMLIFPLSLGYINICSFIAVESNLELNKIEQ